MNERAIINDAADFAREILARGGSGHDWWHTYRVWQLAKNIAKAEKASGVGVVAVELAAILHDLVDPKIIAFTGIIAQDIEERLRGYGLDQNRIDKVMTGVQNTSFSRTIGKEGVVTENLPIEAKIISDADKLDAIGAIGIGRAFAYGGSKSRLMYDPDRPPQTYQSAEEYHANDTPTINHFYEKLLLLKDRMFTAAAKKMAELGMPTWSDFWKNFMPSGRQTIMSKGG